MGVICRRVITTTEPPLSCRNRMSSGASCPLCQHALDETGSVVKLWMCAHKVHASCAKASYIECAPTCPICRSDYAPSTMSDLAVFAAITDDASTEFDTSADISVGSERANDIPPPLIMLCCKRVAHPPNFEALPDRRMRWVSNVSPGNDDSGNS